MSADIHESPYSTGRFPLAKRFLSLVRYSDVYYHSIHQGDGNKLGSPSDIETRNTLEEIATLAQSYDAALSALATMEKIATKEGWNTGLFSSEYGESLRDARMALALARFKIPS